MKLTITGIHMDTGTTLQAHTEEKLAKLREHFDHLTDVHVAYTHNHNYHADITLHVNGAHLKAEGRGVDPYVAMNDATKKLVAQLDKHKGRLQKHRKDLHKADATLNAMAEEAA